MSNDCACLRTGRGRSFSLEDKHRLTQEALDHYREQHLLQREQEVQRHDQQLQQLQREARTNRDQLLSKPGRTEPVVP